MNRIFLIALFLLNCILVVAQIPEIPKPEIPKFNPVVVKTFGGAPAREKPILLSNIKYWIKPNVEIKALEITDEFIKVEHLNDIVYVVKDNFKDVKEVNNQLIAIIKAEKDLKDYNEYFKKYKDSLLMADLDKIVIEAIKKENVEKEKEIDSEIQRNNQLNALIKKYKSINSPLAMSEASVSFNSIGIPEANLSVYNITDKEIDAFEITILCYDNYNRPVNHYLYKVNSFKGLSQDTIQSGDESSGTWTLHGYENTTKIKIILKSVHYKRYGAWYPKNIIQIKSE